MFRFENPQYLYFLILIPLSIIAWLVFLRAERRKGAKVAEDVLLKRMMPEWKPREKRYRFLIFLVILTLLIIALANPQWSGKRERITVTGSDIFIVLDISQSMTVEDIPPNRMERAKKLLEKLVESLKGNRIGLILFAGDAFIQVPLTADYAAVLLAIKSANPGQIINQGTAIEAAFDIAEKSFAGDEKNQKALVIVSDGEDHDGSAVSRAKKAQQDGMLIFTIGVGSSEGGFIPEPGFGGSMSYKKDLQGKFIKSKVNTVLLSDIADAGKGSYYSVLEGDNLVNKLTMQLEKLEKREMEQRSFTDFESWFRYFLIVAVFLLIAEFFRPEKKRGMKV